MARTGVLSIARGSRVGVVEWNWMFEDGHKQMVRAPSGRKVVCFEALDLDDDNKQEAFRGYVGSIIMKRGVSGTRQVVLKRDERHSSLVMEMKVILFW